MVWTSELVTPWRRSDGRNVWSRSRLAINERRFFVDRASQASESLPSSLMSAPDFQTRVRNAQATSGRRRYARMSWRSSHLLHLYASQQS